LHLDTLESTRPSRYGALVELDPHRFVGLGFVASYWNADPNTIAPLSAVTGLAVQIAWGMGPAERTEPGDELRAWVRKCKEMGLAVQPWGWCNAGDVEHARAEGRFHAECCHKFSFDTWIANMEEPYDAHGNSSSPRYTMPTAYANGFTGRAAELGLKLRALAITTTPTFASSTAELAGAGWVTMPQAFSGADPSATVAAVVKHMAAWGWPAARIRPLVQVYATDERRPPAQPYLEESATAGVGVVPYIVEQALDDDGRARLIALTSATMRPPSSSRGNGERDGGETTTGVGIVSSLRTAWDELEQSKADGAWRRDNPSEVNALKSYWDAPAGTPAPTTIKTHYGKGLLALAEARRYAEGSHA
jgi:hypothetical protein